MNEMTD